MKTLQEKSLNKVYISLIPLAKKEITTGIAQF